ncbi:type I restriction endonuclease subunit R, EcoR124 family, partial [Rubritalea tangerina]|uniref:type I restriction endonuclease subunit R, EcoR124 family n=1 Tax=Rubritalea tangerina TaxID=430798 RepID=UPI003610E6C3
SNYDEFTSLKELQKVDLSDGIAPKNSKRSITSPTTTSRNEKNRCPIRACEIQDYRSTYNDTPVSGLIVRGETTTTINQPSIGMMSSSRSTCSSRKKINLDYILELIVDKKKANTHQEDLIEDVRKAIRASLGSRAKESLVVDFINQTDLDTMGDKASVMEDFYAYAQEQQRNEAESIIADENLNRAEARRYIKASLKREYASENGTALNATLPKMSPLNPSTKPRNKPYFRRFQTSSKNSKTSVEVSDK